MDLSQKRDWRFAVNVVSQVHGPQGSETHSRLLRNLKYFLLGDGAWQSGDGLPSPPPMNPFAVIASSDGVSSGFDGVDRWSSNGSIVWNTPTGNRSWIVLRQTGVSSKFEVLLSCESSSSAAKHKLTVVVSPREGFGVSNGGTDGSLNTRPTALDQIVVGNQIDWGATSSATVPVRFHISMSDDGSDTRIFFTRNNVLAGMWMFSTATPNDSLAWPNPSVSLVKADSQPTPGADVISRFSLMNNQFLFARIADITGCSLACTAESVGGGTIFDVQTIKNQTTGKWPVGEIGLYSTSNLDVGHHGSLIDMFWVPAVLFPTTILSDAFAGYEWRKLGPFATPWPGNTNIEMNV